MKTSQFYTDKALDPAVLWGHRVWDLCTQPGPGLGGPGHPDCLGVRDFYPHGVSWGCVIPSALKA